jgi:hypothetical protein
MGCVIPRQSNAVNIPHHTNAGLEMNPHCAVRTDASQNAGCFCDKDQSVTARWKSCIARTIWTKGGALVFGGVYSKQEAV